MVSEGFFILFGSIIVIAAIFIIWILMPFLAKCCVQVRKRKNNLQLNILVAFGTVNILKVILLNISSRGISILHRTQAISATAPELE